MIPGQIWGRFVTGAPCCAPRGAAAAPARVGGAVAADGAAARVRLDWGCAPHHQPWVSF